MPKHTTTSDVVLTTQDARAFTALSNTIFQRKQQTPDAGLTAQGLILLQGSSAAKLEKIAGELAGSQQFRELEC